MVSTYTCTCIAMVHTMCVAYMACVWCMVSTYRDDTHFVCCVHGLHVMHGEYVCPFRSLLVAGGCKCVWAYPGCPQCDWGAG